jgi:molecular chaperone GrpE
MNEQAFDKKHEAEENHDNMTQAENTGAAENASAVPDAEQEGAENQSAEELEQIKAERDEAKDKYLRLVAEFENFRKRNARERMELIQTAGKEVVQSLLEVLDDFERATGQIEKSTDIVPIKEGVSLVFGKLRTTLQQKGLRMMECLHQDFDPELHEAIAEIPAPSEEMKGKILDVTQAGYYLNDKLIRHAKVVVGK